MHLLGAYACGGEVVSLIIARAEVPDLVSEGALPNLKPLLAWEQELPARVLAVLDRKGADLPGTPVEAQNDSTAP